MPDHATAIAEKSRWLQSFNTKSIRFTQVAQLSLRQLALLNRHTAAQCADVQDLPISKNYNHLYSPIEQY